MLLSEAWYNRCPTSQASPLRFITIATPAVLNARI
jgi:hypothetical protein